MNIFLSSLCGALFIALSSWSTPQEDLRCTSNDDCGLIPLSGCLGCANGEGHWVVNKKAAQRIMSPKRNQCMAELKSFRPEEDSMKTHESCEQFNAANCENGLCVGVLLSKEDLSKRGQKLSK